MPIVSSVFSVGPPQAGGRSYVTERHTDTTGEVHIKEYLTLAGTNYAAVMAASAIVIAERLADSEANGTRSGALVLQHQTKPQYLLRLRSRYRLSRLIDTCRIAHRMLKHITDGDCTANQMQAAWEMSPPEWTAKAAQLQTKANKWTAFVSAENAADNEEGD